MNIRKRTREQSEVETGALADILFFLDDVLLDDFNLG